MGPDPRAPSRCRIVRPSGCEADVRALHVAVHERRRRRVERAHERSRIGEQRGDAVGRPRRALARSVVQPSPISVGSGLSSAACRFERRAADGRKSRYRCASGEETDVVVPVPPRRVQRGEVVARTRRAARRGSVRRSPGGATTPTSRIRSTPSRPSRAVVTTAWSIAVGQLREHASFPQRELAQSVVARSAHQPVAAGPEMLRDVRDAVDREAFDRRAGLASASSSSSRALARARGGRRSRRSSHRSPVQPSRFQRDVADRRLGRRRDRPVPPRAHDRRLARGPEQGAVLGPQVHEPVPEAVGDRVHADVGEHPVGRHAVRDPQRVVEAVAAGPPTERLADARRHEVADDRERGGRHLEQLGEAHPDRRGARALRSRQLPERAPGRDAFVEPAPDRVVSHVVGARGADTRRAAGRRAASPTARRRASGRSPSAPSTVSTSVSPTCAITRAWLMWCPRTTSTASSSSTDGGDAYERYCAVAHTHGRPVTCSITSIAAPSPQPPNSARRPDVSPGTIGIRHLSGSSVAFEPEERQCIHRRADATGRRHPPNWRELRATHAAFSHASSRGAGQRTRSARRSTRPACCVSFMPVSVRSVWRMRQASMRCA